MLRMLWGFKTMRFYHVDCYGLKSSMNRRQKDIEKEREKRKREIYRERRERDAHLDN